MSTAPMVLRLTRQKREEKQRVRQALLDAALALAALHGFAGVGLREVSRAAAIAPTSFYRHFSDMEELGVGLVSERVRPLLAAIAQHAEHGRDRTTRLAAVAGAALAAAERAPELVRFIVAEQAGASPALRAALRGELAKLARALASSSEPASPVSEPIGDAALALVLDGMARALELGPPRRAALEAGLTIALERLLSAGAPPRPV